ncbi:ImmA/IrrE family metallo-endopeptidase [Bacillus gobiensis]|uniref:ImmA/IrrE family metallo-endopeptidase n=1 Tax=Bacillus gobiensis TaxID=1441095 RepID=UPI003D2367CD
MKYTYSHLEDWIANFYKKINIVYPEDLDFENIARKLGIWIHYKEVKSQFIERNGLYSIILDSRLPKVQQRIDFGHEVCHIFRHEGDQTEMHEEWIRYQEKQARYFALHFCVPTFMLKNIKLTTNHNHAAGDIADTFKVPIPFAKTRLQVYRNKFSICGMV